MLATEILLDKMSDIILEAKNAPDARCKAYYIQKLEALSEALCAINEVRKAGHTTIHEEEDFI